MQIGPLQARIIEGQRGWYAARAAAAQARIDALLATQDAALLPSGS